MTTRHSKLAPQLSKLLWLLRRYALHIPAPGTLIPLASGAKAPYYIDIKRASLHRDVFPVLAGCLHAQLDAWVPLDAVAGVALGGCQLASIVSFYAAMMIGEPRLDALFVRKERSTHGMMNIVEGSITNHPRVVLLEDVVTTGESSIKAVNALKDAGCNVQGVLAVVDNRNGKVEMNETLTDGAPFRALFTFEQFVGG